MYPLLILVYCHEINRLTKGSVTGLDRRRRRGRHCAHLQTDRNRAALNNCLKSQKSCRVYLGNLHKFKKKLDEKSQPKRATSPKRGKICRVTGTRKARENRNVFRNADWLMKQHVSSDWLRVSK